MADKNALTSTPLESQESRGIAPKAVTAVATALLAFQLQVAQAQTTPVSPSTSASAAADQKGGQMTQDGRDFVSLSEKDVDGLSRVEKKAYYTWKNAQLDATIVSEDQANEGRKATIVSKKGEGRQLDATINQIDTQDIAIVGTVSRVFPVYEKLLVQQGNLKTLSQDAKGLIQYVVKWKKPPAFVEQAEKFIRYI